MTQAILREDLEFALDTQINKIRLLKDLIFDAASSEDSLVFQLAQARDKKGFMLGLHQMLQDLVSAYDELTDGPCQ